MPGRQFHTLWQNSHSRKCVCKGPCAYTAVSSDPGNPWEWVRKEFLSPQKRLSLSETPPALGNLGCTARTLTGYSRERKLGGLFWDFPYYILEAVRAYWSLSVSLASSCSFCSVWQPWMRQLLSGRALGCGTEGVEGGAAHLCFYIRSGMFVLVVTALEASGFLVLLIIKDDDFSFKWKYLFPILSQQWFPALVWTPRMSLISSYTLQSLLYKKVRVKNMNVTKWPPYINNYGNWVMGRWGCTICAIVSTCINVWH